MHGIDDRLRLLGISILLACSSAPRLTASSTPVVVAKMPDAKADAAQPRANAARADPTGVHATYVFDRNRLQDSRRVGSFLMALTDSGHLLRFDATTFALVGERLARRRVTCLGPVDKGGLLAGLDDGTIVRIAAETLLAERVGEVPGQPVRLGQRPSNQGLVVAYGHLTERFYGYGRSPQGIRIRDLPSGRTWRPSGVFGLVELSNGQVRSAVLYSAASTLFGSPSRAAGAITGAPNAGRRLGQRPSARMHCT
jgi:hypothetical protein